MPRPARKKPTAANGSTPQTRGRARTPTGSPANPRGGTRPAKPALDLPSPWTVDDVLAALRAEANASVRDGMVRYAIAGAAAEAALGVRMASVWAVAARASKKRPLDERHALAAKLWETGVYEAMMVATGVDHPSCVTEDQMDAWCRDFDNWAVCDTACFKLFDGVEPAIGLRALKRWAKGARAIGGGEDEFVVRAAFAMLASLAQHNPACTDAQLRACLPLAERATTDGRNFVKKAVSWALRTMGGRRPALRAEVVALSRRLATSDVSSARWVGKDVLRELV